MKSYKEYLTEEFKVSSITPKKIIKGYKLFKVKKGKIYPLYVNAKDEVKLGVWLDATEGEILDTGQVKSKLGPLAYRPGWHSGEVPMATHIGIGGVPPKYRANDQVWAEVEIPDDYDWQTVANSRGVALKKDSKANHLKKGDINPKTAHITDQIPKNGNYKYKTNPNMSGSWIISGQIKVKKILTDKQVEAINNANGVADLPRKEPLDLKAIGF